MKVLLDDGTVSLTVQEVNVREGNAFCTIDNSGEIRSRAGVNLPGATTDMPAMSEKDKQDIKYGLQIGVDYVAASFIQNAAGVREIRDYMNNVMKNEKGPHWDKEMYPLPLLISKIESASALINFDEILDESDGIMVARGDLGVEIPLQQVTRVQKELVAKCNAVGKPVIVATQMLESMAKNPRPTRAEVADVTNAVLDGADAVMLSGETAKGKYPAESVKMMSEIIMNAEEFAKTRPDLGGAIGSPLRMESIKLNHSSKKNFLVSIAKACVTAAEEQNATAIIVLTRHGSLGRMISAFRPKVPIIAFCPHDVVARRLMIFRGVHPIVGLTHLSPEQRPVAAIRDAKVMGFVKPGDDVVMVTGEVNENMDNTVSMRIATVS
jgi:pyruvate kinase